MDMCGLFKRIAMLVKMAWEDRRNTVTRAVTWFFLLCYAIRAAYRNTVTPVTHTFRCVTVLRLRVSP
jgi:hypothetical protein